MFTCLSDMSCSKHMTDLTSTSSPLQARVTHEELHFRLFTFHFPSLDIVRPLSLRFFALPRLNAVSVPKLDASILTIELSISDPTSTFLSYVLCLLQLMNCDFTT